MKRPLFIRIATSRMFLPVLFGGMALQVNLGGCDADVRNAVLTGVSTSLTSLSSALINAFFMSLLDAGTSTTQPVVQATFDMLWGTLG